MMSDRTVPGGDSHADVYSEQCDNCLELFTTQDSVYQDRGQEDWFTRPRPCEYLKTPQLRKSSRVRFSQVEEVADNHGTNHSKIREWENPFQPGGSLSKEADILVSSWKAGRLGQEFGGRDHEHAGDEAGDALDNSSDENPQVSGNILPRKAPTVNISAVDIHENNEKKVAQCCIV